MKRILLCVAYDGTNYSGWQLQDNAPTIEGELNKALSNLHGEKITVIGASRTDAGVHALCNMAVYDTDARMPSEKVSLALNTVLPEDIKAVWSREVAPDFHPRHTNTVKTYEYTIYNAPIMPPTKRLYACIVQDATACCAQGLEFEPESTLSYPDDYPEPGTEITVIGTFDSYREETDGNTYIYLVLRNARMV